MHHNNFKALRAGRRKVMKSEPKNRSLRRAQAEWNIEYRMSKEGINRKENRRTEECRMSNVEGMYSVYFMKKD